MKMPPRHLRFLLPAALAALLAISSTAAASTQPRAAGARGAGAALQPVRPTAAASAQRSSKSTRTVRKRPALPVNEQRAIASYVAMQRAYYVPAVQLYLGNPYAYLWPFTHALAATIDIAGLPHMHNLYRGDLEARLRGLQTYWAYGSVPPIGYLGTAGRYTRTIGVRYFDDNEWVALDLVRLYRENHLAELLTISEQIFTLVVNAWDTQKVAACPGGIPFTDVTVNGDRNTTTNAPAAELAVELYELTGQSFYLDWAKSLYGWVRSCMLASDGAYADHVNGQGKLDPTEWTYNQGSMIGAGAMLFVATRDRTYLDQSEATARVAMAKFSGPTLESQPIPFNAIYLRNLLLLGTVAHRSTYLAYAKRYGDSIWAHLRDPRSGLFLADGGGRTQLLDSAAMVQVYAMLSEPLTKLY